MSVIYYSYICEYITEADNIHNGKIRYPHKVRCERAPDRWRRLRMDHHLYSFLPFIRDIEYFYMEFMACRV